MKSNRLHRWCPTAFMLGGAMALASLPLIFVVQAGAELLMPLVAVLSLLGVAAMILGTIGLFPPLAATTERTLARIGLALVSGFVALALLALLVIGGLSLIRATGLSAPEPPPFGLATPPLFGSIVLGQAIFGIAAWRARAPSRLVGGLSVVLAASWVVGFAVGTRSEVFDIWDLLALGLPAFGTMVLGYLLARGAKETEATGGDSATGMASLP